MHWCGSEINCCCKPQRNATTANDRQRDTRGDGEGGTGGTKERGAQGSVVWRHRGPRKRARVGGSEGRSPCGRLWENCGRAQATASLVITVPAGDATAAQLARAWGWWSSNSGAKKCRLKSWVVNRRLGGPLVQRGISACISRGRPGRAVQCWVRGSNRLAGPMQMRLVSSRTSDGTAPSAYGLHSCGLGVTATRVLSMCRQ
ncbi:MAG: hypothetical protein J3K34DRAFT_114816 [Monoraphidium minutum]|nr:MAG: hypothetical protein J3K34DRAFT_114816 [Monoraphidium minutum]